MKLKTLKDFETKHICYCHKHLVIREKELKAVAIKWVKYYKTMITFPEYRNGQINSLIEFFNITEDDLK